ncbi:PREDICTED: uncharacterized protein LOC106806281 isoform X2 [Priapulus caudatus]|nr:PREDICTED: uncharacterized protein LOC106806281 isoform X2 [Priapulus caudatus]XP_014663650.1 PREDICTED: uncharacterized protein LOC106806281 isoform X2 [Priapulus caudatus]
MSQEAVDVEQLILDWAWQRVESWPKSEKKLRKLASKHISPTDINWRHFRSSQTTLWHDEQRAPAPKSHVLFSAIFTNTTPAGGDSQTHNLKTERTTRSSCTVSVTKGMTYGAECSVKLAPPNPIIQANAGFKAEYVMQSSNAETFEEQLTWSVDSEVPVPANTQTRAELVLEEDEYVGTFTQTRCLEGELHVAIRSHKDQSLLATVHGDVCDILDGVKGFRIERSDAGAGKVYFETKGKVKCRYGIRQHLKMSQMPIDA